MDPFIGQIRMFGGNFAPVYHALCDGQYMLIAQNDALFSLLGTFYGGNGANNFCLPDLRGRLPAHFGQGPGLSRWDLGMMPGTETVTLTQADLPQHTHAVEAMAADATTAAPNNNYLASGNGGDIYRDAPASNPVNLASGTLSTTGGLTAHTNSMPALCISFIIALAGIYPSRN